ncbi:MAG: HNH endonuclease [Acidobacteria bacterium]|nr:HNH endonuclease [Acidobacteriota bacterium]
MQFELKPYHRNVSDEDLLKDLKRVSDELGKNKVTIDEYNERGTYHSTTLTRRFGNWFKSLGLAGLSKTRNLNISNEDLFQNLVEVWATLERQPKYQDLTSLNSKFSVGTYEYRFGSWRKALEAFVKWANEGEVENNLPESESIVKKHKTPRNINYRLRFLVMRRDNFKCKITGKSPATDPNVILEVDHIIPWDKGGETVIENLQTLAKEINIGKSNLNMYERKREDWDELFKQAIAEIDDNGMIGVDIENEFDKTEWQ